MQKREFGNSHLQALVLNAIWENSSLKHRTFLVTLALVAASFLGVASAEDAATSKPEQAATSATPKVIKNGRALSLAPSSGSSQRLCWIQTESST